jgi:alpha-ribazole phosphatase
MDVDCDTTDERTLCALAEILPRDAVWLITPLRRTRRTFEAIAAKARSPDPLPPPLVEPAFAEQNFGRWQGLSWEEMQAANPAAYAGFWRDPTRSAPPEGESFCFQMDRTRAAIERLSGEYPGRDIVSISHGGTIRAAVAMALNLTPEAAMAVVVDNLSVTRLSHVEDGLLKAKGGVWLVQGVNIPGR